MKRDRELMHYIILAIIEIVIACGLIIYILNIL